jgi:hypothetical protein
MSEREVPPPEVTSRDRWPDDVDVPRGIRSLERGAVAAGWAVSLTYSRGWCLPVKLADPPYRVHTIAVRFYRDFGAGRVRAGYVVYHCRVDRAPKWEAKSLLVYGSDHDPVVSALGVSDVGRYLVDGPDWTGHQVHEWRDALRAKALEAKQRATVAAKARKPKGKAGVS